jgi:hypothetical protein
MAIDENEVKKVVSILNSGGGYKPLYPPIVCDIDYYWAEEERWTWLGYDKPVYGIYARDEFSYQGNVVQVYLSKDPQSDNGFFDEDEARNTLFAFIENLHREKPDRITVSKSGFEWKKGSEIRAKFLVNQDATTD